ncbi:hypothetical protein C8Q80DRAFT_1091140 [Daedaleopsis nitida]|nr:hypothetical protein C8Q80DRAFT_1091140 [Daedaleopsis nitida]
MQPLTFSPALGRLSTLKITPFPHDQSDGDHEEVIEFKATFNSHELYVKAQSEGIRVEVWTNIPFDGRPRGEWGALPLAPVESVQDRGQEVLTRTQSPPSEERQAMRDEHAMHLSLRTPLQVGSRFQFTYRLVYPSGHVQWLNDDSGDGILQVEQGLPGISLVKECEMQNGRYRVNFCPSSGVLARVEHPDDWTIWVWNPSSYPARFTGTEPTLARALMLSPRSSSRHHQDVFLPKPLVLLAHASSSLRLSPDGTVSSHHLDGPGQVTLGILERSRDLLDQIMSICNGHLLAWDTTFVVLASRHAHAVQPFHVLVLPIVPGTSSVPLSVLQPVAAQMMSDGLALYSPQQRKARLLNTCGLQESGNLLCSCSGDEFIVAPIHISRSNDKEWLVAFLAPCKEVAVKLEASSPSELLPTPPPSPPAHVPSTMNINVAAGESVPRDITGQEEAPPATSSSRGRPPRQQHRRTPSLSLIRNLPARLLRVYLHTIFNVVFWFWDVFFRALTVRLLGKGMTRRITSILDFALSVTASRHRTAQNSRRPQEPETPRISPESGAPSDAGDHPSRQSSTSASAPGDIELVACPQPQYPSRPRKEPVSAQSARRIVLTAAVVQKHHMPFVILRGPRAMVDVKAALNGTPLPSPSIAPLGDGAHLLMLECVEEVEDGQLEVSFDISSTQSQIL